MNRLRKKSKFIVSVIVLITFIGGFFVPPGSMTQASWAAGGLPDLTVESVSLPESLTAGQQAGVTAAVYNGGGSRAAGPITVTLYAKQSGGAYQEVQAQTVASSVYPEAATDVSFNWMPAVAGTYTLKIAADSENKIAESNEENNTLEKDVIVSGESALRQGVQSAVDSTAAVVLSNHHSMDWVAVGLARSGKQQQIPAGYLDSVIDALNSPDNHTLTFKSKPTEFERMTLGVLAAGGDPTSIGGYNMIKQIYSADLASQGINAMMFGLIAADAGNYDVPADARWTREKMIEYILERELPGGGWVWGWDPGDSAKAGDPDITGMTMTALAPYYSQRDDVKEAVDRAVDYLSGIQKANGGYDSWGSVNSESCAQVIMGLCANGMDPTGPRFTKANGNVVQALLSFKAADGGFKHIYSEASSNGMANEQALYALAQYLYFLDGQGSIYRWGDREPAGIKSVTVRVEGRDGVILPDCQTQVSGEAGSLTVKDAVCSALEENQIGYSESGGGFAAIGNETAGPSERWLCSVEDGLPVSDLSARQIHNQESVVVYLGRDTTDYTYAWLEIPRLDASGRISPLQTSIFKPHEVEVYEGQEIPLTLKGHLFASAAAGYSAGPVSGAAVYVDGQQATVSTDGLYGNATVKIDTTGPHTVTARKEGMRTACFTVNVLPDGLAPTVGFSSHLPVIINQGGAETVELFWVYTTDNKDKGIDVAMSVTLNGNELEPSLVNQSNGSRRFSDVTFDQYCNVLAVTVTDRSGNSQTVNRLVVNLNKDDNRAPEIHVTGLTDRMTVRNALLAFTVEISDEQGAVLLPAVKANGNALTAADDNISYTCTLVRGDNFITVNVSDATGHFAQRIYTVTYNPPADTTPPAFADGYPRTTNISAGGFNLFYLQIKMNESGVAYYKVVTVGTAPGSDYAGWPSTAIPRIGAVAVGVYLYGLTAGTAYDVYVIARDTAGNWQAAPVKLEVTTQGSSQTGFTIERVGEGDFELGADARVILKITNNSPEPQQATLIVCLYDNQRSGMVNYSYLFRTLAAGEEVELAGGFRIPDTGDFSVKALVWDSFENMEPLLESPLVIDVN